MRQQQNLRMTLLKSYVTVYLINRKNNTHSTDSEFVIDADMNEVYLSKMCKKYFSHMACIKLIICNHIMSGIINFFKKKKKTTKKQKTTLVLLDFY